MASEKLTAIQVKNAKYEGRPYKLSDGGGLYLLVNKSGKYFRYDYRFNEKRKTLAIGPYSKTPLAKARELHKEARKLLSSGVDPCLHKKQTKLAKKTSSVETFEALAREWFDKKKAKWVDRYSRTIMQRLELNVFPYIGTMAPNDISPAILLNVLQRMEARGVHDTTRRVRQICSKIFQYGIAAECVDRNPAEDIKGLLTTVKPSHMPTIKEPYKIGELLRAIDGYSGNFTTLCALRLAPILFVRPGELRHMQWNELDLDNAVWKIPGHKMKMRVDHVVPLPKQAIAILHEIEPVTKFLPGSKKYVFPSIRSNDRPMSDNTINAALRRLGYTSDEIVGHGFRAMASTNLHEKGWRSEVKEKQLAHNDKNSVRAAYNHAEHLPERIEMMQHWADYLDSLKNMPR